MGYELTCWKIRLSGLRSCAEGLRKGDRGKSCMKKAQEGLRKRVGMERKKIGLVA